jgi:hypothetical protein
MTVGSRLGMYLISYASGRREDCTPVRSAERLKEIKVPRKFKVSKETGRLRLELPSSTTSSQESSSPQAKLWTL